jgi:diguanylate cyclase (GGDEF)-like protein
VRGERFGELGKRFPVTLSVGVATRVTSDIDLEALLARADKALYSAKKEGRDRVVAARGGETSVVGKA